MKLFLVKKKNTSTNQVMNFTNLAEVEVQQLFVFFLYMWAYEVSLFLDHFDFH